MKRTLNRESLKEMLKDTEYYSLINKTLEEKLDNGITFFNTTPYSYYEINITAPENLRGVTLSVTAWCDKELVYNASGKLKRIEHTVHSLIITRQIIKNGQYQTVDLFRHVELSPDGAIRNDRKTEKDIA